MKTLRLPVFHRTPGFEDMHKIAALNNARVAKGEKPVVIVGHQPDDGDEKPAIGTLANFSAAERNGVETLFADVSVRDDKASALEDFPRRSIEIFADGLISGLAFLGGTQPALDLGLAFQRAGVPKKFSRRKVRKFQVEFLDSSMQEESQLSPDEQRIIDLVMKLPILARLQAQFDKEDVEALAQPAPEAAAPIMNAVPPVEPVDSAPLPVEASAEPDSDDENKELKFKLAETTRKFVRAERENALLALLNEGFAFELREELDETLTPEQFSRQLQRIRKNYQKAPVGLKFSKPRTSSELSELDMDRIRDYATANNISYSTAKAKLTKESIV